MYTNAGFIQIFESIQTLKNAETKLLYGALQTYKQVKIQFTSKALVVALKKKT